MGQFRVCISLVHYMKGSILMGTKLYLIIQKWNSRMGCVFECINIAFSLQNFFSIRSIFYEKILTILCWFYLVDTFGLTSVNLQSSILLFDLVYRIQRNKTKIQKQKNRRKGKPSFGGKTNKQHQVQRLSIFAESSLVLHSY